ncbi:MAG: GntR family transcriptional regulator [Sneathiella sp.]|nr:GntR family transcriptional regulator [Sneathiella sp.]
MIRRKNSPKYLQIAKAISKRITDDTYSIGSTLPTETFFMDEFQVSRQTVRKSVSLLKEWGMASTRHGSGTAVLSKGNEDGYIQKFGSLADLLQHDAHTQINYRESKHITVSRDLAQLVGCAPQQPFWRLTVIRKSKKTDFVTSWVDLYVRESHQHIIDMIGRFPNRMIHTLIEEGYGEKVVEIEQEIDAALIPDEAADAFQIPRGTVGMRAIRRYFGSNKRLILTGVNFHPAGHYTYRATLLRESNPKS